MDGQSYLLLIRDEGGPPELQVSVYTYWEKKNQHQHQSLRKRVLAHTPLPPCLLSFCCSPPPSPFSAHTHLKVITDQRATCSQTPKRRQLIFINLSNKKNKTEDAWAHKLWYPLSSSFWSSSAIIQPHAETEQPPQSSFYYSFNLVWKRKKYIYIYSYTYYTLVFFWLTHLPQRTEVLKDLESKSPGAPSSSPHTCWRLRIIH